MGAIDADHHHGCKRRQFDRHPHEADIVGDQCEVHAEHHHLIHRVIETQIGRCQTPCFQLVADIACAEHACREADEGVEHDEDDVEIVDEEICVDRWMRDEERERGQKRQQARQHVEPRREPVTGKDAEQGGCCGRDRQNQGHAVEYPAHRRSPRKRSSARTSTVSKRSRMRNRNIPITMKAIRTEKATLISTTSGIPLAPVAARTRPFSSDMKPTTWPTALRLVTMISRPSRRTESAKARSSRAIRLASVVTRNMTAMESPTRPIPTSMTGPMLVTVSISRWMPSCTIMR